MVTSTASKVMVLGMLTLAAPAAWATDFTVTNTNDSGAGSLRQAIVDANSNQGADTIKFNIPGAGVHKIAPRSDLPEINDTVVIDGYTQPGASVNTLNQGNNAKLLIELDGTNAGPPPNAGLQLFDGAQNSTVRGLVINNFDHSGIYMGWPSGNGITLEGNFIGTDASGTQDLGNEYGVYVKGGNGNTIGGTASGGRNIISGNNRDGVRVDGSGASGNKVEGNYIGTDATGAKNLRNYRTGVVVQDGASNNTIGGTTAGEGNVIAFSHFDGVEVAGSTSTANSILSNSVFSNGRLGIELGDGGDDGVSANDSGDGDTGPNDLQNFPTLTKANEAPNGFTKIEGTLNSTPSSSFKVQFFSSPQKDSSGHGEGQRFLGEQSVATDTSGNADFSFTTPQAKDGEYLSATATNSNSNTSEFSNAVIVNTAPEAASQSITTGEDTAKTITLSATDAEGDTLTFEIFDKPRHGALSSIGAVTCDGAGKCSTNVTYKPSPDYYGEDSFSYKAIDGELESAPARVSITVNSVNDAPKATDDAYSVDEDQTLTVPDGSTDLLANDSDIEGDTLTAIEVAGSAHGQVSLSADGSFTYTPSKDYYGTDSFTYMASDGTLVSTTATVRITVKDATAPDAPVINSPAEGARLNVRSFSVSGTAEAGAEIELFEGEVSKGEATTGADGAWSVDLTGVSDGSHTYTAKAIDRAGNTSAESEARTVTVDATAPEAPVITSPREGSYDTDGSFTLSGTAEPNTSVELFDGGNSLNEAVAVNASGNWWFELINVPEGYHAYTAKAIDAAGNTSAESEAHTVIVDITAPSVRRVVPLENATDIAPGTNVAAVFSEAMKATSINQNTFKLYKKGSTTAITATVTYDAATKRAILNPSVTLERGASYRAVVNGGARDLAGNHLDQDPSVVGNQQKLWFFTIRP